MRKCGYLCHLQENWLLESFRHKDVMRKHQAPNSCLKPERKSPTSTLSPKGCRQQFFGGILDPPMMIHGTWWATSKGSPLSKIRATWRWWPLLVLWGSPFWGVFGGLLDYETCFCFTGYSLLYNAVHLLSSSLDVFRNAFTRHNQFRLQTNEAALKIRFQPYRFPVFVSTVSRVSNFT